MISLSKYKEIIVWGASFPPSDLKGEATSHGRAIEQLRNLLIKSDSWNKVVAIVDSNVMLHGKNRLGIEVFEPAHIKNYPEALIIINTISFRAIEKAMEDLDITNDYVIVPYYFYHGTIEHPYMNDVAKQDTIKNQAAIRELYDIEDDETKRYLDIIFETRLNGEDVLYSPMYYDNTGIGIPYFCDDKITPSGEVTFIDVGAYDGDSIKPVACHYGERLSRIIAFEPNKNVRSQLVAFLQKVHLEEKAEVLPYALGNKEEVIGFSATGQTGQIDDESNEQIEQRIFDNIEGLEILGEPLVKMDIEGGEMDALYGMERFIKQFEPYLAICIYHKETDLYNVARFIKSINSGYRIYIRGGWHLECWAVPQRHFK